MLDAVDSFDEGAWYALVDHVTVYDRDEVWAGAFLFLVSGFANNIKMQGKSK